MKLVLDASVTLKWILDPLNEPDSERAHRLLLRIRDGVDDLYAPPHWVAETLAVVARSAAPRIFDTLEVVYGLRFHEVSSRSTHEFAANLSAQLNHHLFDTLYHAVAIGTGATLVTADVNYFRKARDLGNIELLTTFP